MLVKRLDGFLPGEDGPAAVVQNLHVDAFAIDPTKVRDISSRLLDDRGRLRITPARMLEETTAQERLMVGVRQGIYSFPTDELCDFLRSRIEGRVAIETGAGHGILAEHWLFLPPITVSKRIRNSGPTMDGQIGQPTVSYGGNVEKLDAEAAVAKY